MESILNTLKERYIIEQRIGKKSHVFLLTQNNRKYFAKLKYNPRPKSGLKTKLIDILGLTDLLFQKELLVLKSLNKKDSSYFKYPKLIESDNQNYIITEYIEGKSQIEINKHNEEKIVKALSELQKSADIVRFPIRHRIISFFSSPMIFIFRSTLSNAIKYCGSRVAFKVLTLSCKINLRNKKQKRPILTHSDIRQEIYIVYPEDNICFQNLMIDNNNNIYFIDFGSVLISKKFFMQDIVNLCFDARKEKLNWRWIISFLNEMESWISYTGDSLKDHIRIALIHNILNRMHGGKYRKESITFLKKVLLSNKEYQIWYNAQSSAEHN